MHRKAYLRHGCSRPRSSYGRTSHRFGGGHRARRGDTRAAVLALLAERPMHGYEMIQELETRTGGAWRPSPGSIYPTLAMLEDEGLIESEATGGRKRFTLTEAGRAEAEQAADSAPWAGYDDDLVTQARQFKEAGLGIMAALRQVAVDGTDEQRAQALEILNDTRRRLYGLLAEAE
jgi:DNA-binding PadR family transcriptional regulator